MTELFVSPVFPLVTEDCSLLAGSDGSGSWPACLSAWWLRAGDRRGVLQLQPPGAAIALYLNSLLYGKFPCGRSLSLVPADAQMFWEQNRCARGCVVWGMHPPALQLSARKGSSPLQATPPPSCPRCKP